MRVQFVVGLHSVPYLFNSNFYQLTLRASNDRVLFFFAPVSALSIFDDKSAVRAGGEGQGRGVARRRKHLRCIAIWCGYTVWLHRVAVLCSYTVWSYCVAVLLYLWNCCAVSRRERYPQGLSTVWRTYMHVIWWRRGETCHGCNLRARQKNSCNYRLSKPLKPRVSS